MEFYYIRTDRNYLVNIDFLEEFMNECGFKESGYNDVIEYAKYKCSRFEKIYISNDFDFIEL